MRPILALCLACLSLAASILHSPAAGLIVVQDPAFWPGPLPQPQPVPPGEPPRRLPPIQPPHRPPAWSPIELTSTQVEVKIRDQVATTEIEQEFYNPNPRQLEGTFLFPVPKGAQLDKFTLEINGRQVEAELLPAAKARGIYEDIVRRLQDPALLEYAGRDVFKVRIFPIEPNARKRLRLSYTQLLPNDGGVIAFTHPLNTQKYSAAPLKRVSFKIQIETRQPLKSIYSPSHAVEIRRQGDRQATVGFEAAETRPDTDFQLYFAPERDDIGLHLLTHRQPGEDGYFLLLASPGLDGGGKKASPKDVCFVLDTSGSMAGAKLEQARKALAFCVENLNDDDRFEVLRFATDVEPVFNRLAAAGRDERRQAQEFIRNLRPTGGTAIDDALRQALALRPAQGERPFVVIFLTDGLPTVGVTVPETILAHVKEASRGNVRVFSFGIGTDVNTHLLDQITTETRASSEYVLPTEDIEVKVSAFFTKVKDPVLANPSISFPAHIRITQLHPSPIPDLFKGGQIVLAGRFSGSGDGAVQIEGRVNGEVRRFTHDVKFPARSEDHAFIPRLWATRRVGYLLDEIRLRGESAELRDETVALARQYNIVTPYTAHLIVEDEARRGVAMERRLYGVDAAGARSGLASTYQRFRADRDGAAAVDGARSLSVLKRAEAPASAISLGSAEAARSQAPLAPAPAASGLAGGARGAQVVTGPTPPGSRPPTDAVSRPAAAPSSSQFVAGKTFFFNGGRWVDSELQQLPNAKPIRIQFGSPEYFQLLAQHPSAPTWLAQGRSLQIVIGGVAYDIVE